jgi:ribonuclease HII
VNESVQETPWTQTSEESHPSQTENKTSPKFRETLDRTFETEVLQKGFKVVAGVDEAGRGPLAGPVVAAACVVPLDINIEGVNDSKKLTEVQREHIFHQLTSHPDVMYGVGIMDHITIDRVNILQATMLAMEQAVDNLSKNPDYVFVDGNRCPPKLREKGRTAQVLIKGDARCYSIAAASVIAKVTRDRLMKGFDSQWPVYGFAQHKGYGTAGHVSAIMKHGPCPIHRKTFAPIKDLVATPPTKILTRPRKTLALIKKRQEQAVVPCTPEKTLSKRKCDDDSDDNDSSASGTDDSEFVQSPTQCLTRSSVKRTDNNTKQVESGHQNRRRRL